MLRILFLTDVSIYFVCLEKEGVSVAVLLFECLCSVAQTNGGVIKILLRQTSASSCVHLQGCFGKCSLLTCTDVGWCRRRRFSASRLEILTPRLNVEEVVSQTPLPKAATCVEPEVALRRRFPSSSLKKKKRSFFFFLFFMLSNWTWGGLLNWSWQRLFLKHTELHLAWREGKLSWELQVLKNLWP